MFILRNCQARLTQKPAGDRVVTQNRAGVLQSGGNIATDQSVSRAFHDSLGAHQVNCKATARGWQEFIKTTTEGGLDQADIAGTGSDGVEHKGIHAFKSLAQPSNLCRDG